MNKMTFDELVSRINELAAKNKTVGLSEAETAERAALRAEYVRRFHENLASGLDAIYYVGDDGKEHKLGLKSQAPAENHDEEAKNQNE